MHIKYEHCNLHLLLLYEKLQARLRCADRRRDRQTLFRQYASERFTQQNKIHLRYMDRRSLRFTNLL